MSECCGDFEHRDDEPIQTVDGATIDVVVCACVRTGTVYLIQEQSPSMEVVCGAVAESCVCSEAPGHEPPHCCTREGCRGQWTGTLGASDFVAVRLPNGETNLSFARRMMRGLGFTFEDEREEVDG